MFSGSETPVWITPKYSIPVDSDKLAFGGGALIGTVIGGDDDFGVVYGTTTLGNRDQNATFGVGYGYIEDDFASRPTFTFSAMIRTSKTAYLITENYFLSTGSDSIGLLSIGGRRIWNNVSLDFGGITPVGGGIDEIIMIPWLSIAVSFGR